MVLKISLKEGRTGNVVRMLGYKVSIELTDEHDKVDSISERDADILEHFFFNSKTAQLTGDISYHRAFQLFKFFGSFTSEFFKVVPEW